MAYKPTKRQREKYRKYKSQYFKNARKIRDFLLLGQSESAREQLIIGNEVDLYTPMLVLPSLREPSRTFKDKQSFLNEYNRFKKLYNVENYFRQSYKHNYVKLIQDAINDSSTTVTGKGLTPESRGYFSQNQINEMLKKDSTIADYMILSNRIQSMPVSRFMTAYVKGYIKPFKEIYNELNVYSSSSDKGNFQMTQLEQAKEMIDIFTKLN